MKGQVGLKVQPKTLVDRDLELIVKLLKIEVPRDLLNLEHHYTIIRFKEVSEPSECYICNAGHRPQRRVAIRNDTLEKTFWCGLDCLEKSFNVKRDDLDRTSLPLKQLAATWEAFKFRTDPTFTGFTNVSTGEAVEDMAQAFASIPMLNDVHQVLAVIQANLSAVQDGLFTEELNALKDLLGILYEAQYLKPRLEDRAKMFADHPLLESAESVFISNVLLNTHQLNWADVISVSNLVGRIRGKKIQLKLREVPVYNFADWLSYFNALDRAAGEKRDAVDHHHEFTRSFNFEHVLTRAIKRLEKQGASLETFAFESTKLEHVERLRPSYDMKMLLEQSSVRLLEAFGGTPYEEVTTRSEKTTLRSFLRNDQLEDDERPQEPRRPHTGYYRAFVLYRPDPYRFAYSVWARYGGVGEGRALMENLASSL